MDYTKSIESWAKNRGLDKANPDKIAEIKKQVEH